MRKSSCASQFRRSRCKREPVALSNGFQWFTPLQMSCFIFFSSSLPLSCTHSLFFSLLPLSLSSWSQYVYVWFGFRDNLHLLSALLLLVFPRTHTYARMHAHARAHTHRWGMLHFCACAAMLRCLGSQKKLGVSVTIPKELDNEENMLPLSFPSPTRVYARLYVCVRARMCV